MKLSIIIPILNSHEIVRRNLLHYKKIGIPNDVDDTEIIFMDDGSDPPLDFPNHGLKNFAIYPTYDMRAWTSSLARNKAAKIAKGDYFLMTDVDYILSRDLIDSAREFNGDKMRFRREFGILDENGDFSQDIPTLLSYGLLAERIPKKGVKLPPHPNNFVMKREVFFQIGGYEDRTHMSYPLGEDTRFKRAWARLRDAGKVIEHEYRPIIYMFPNGQFCGDVDYNPFGLFHNLSRKTERNVYYKNGN